MKKIHNHLSDIVTPEPPQKNYSPIYSSTMPLTSFLFRHLFAILSFVLPFFILLYSMKSAHIEPFGSISLHNTNETISFLSVFYNISNKLHQGTFSILQPSGYEDYLIADILPSFCTSPIRMLLLIAPVQTAISLFPITIIAQYSFGSFCFWFYLTHRPNSPRSIHDPLSLFIPLCYALSSALIVGIGQYQITDCIALFPLTIYLYEKSTTNNNMLKLCLIMAYLHLCHFPSAIFIGFIILYYDICLVGFSKRLHYHIRLFLVMLLSMSLSAITVIPGIYTCLHSNKEFLYSAISIRNIFSSFSSFFWGSDPSYYTTANNGINGYCSCLTIIICLTALFIPSKNKTTRIRTIIFHISLIAILFIPVMQEITVISFPHQTMFFPYCFVLVFFLLCLTEQTISSLYRISKKNFALSSALILGLILIALPLSNNNSNNRNIMVFLILSAAYFFVMYLYLFQGIHYHTFISIICCMLLIELTLNCIQLFSHSDLSKNSVYESLETNLQDMKQNPLYSDGEAHLFADTPISLFELPEIYLIPVKYQKPDITFYSPIDNINKKAFSLGLKTTLFQSYYPALRFNDPQGVTGKQVAHNTYILYFNDTITYPYFISFHCDSPRDGDAFIFLNRCYHVGFVHAKDNIGQFIMIDKKRDNNELPLNKAVAYLDTGSYNTLYNRLSSPNIAYQEFHFNSISLQVSSSYDSTLVLPYKYDPSITLYVDHKPVSQIVGPNNKSACIIPPGDHVVRICHTILPWIIALFVTCFSWIIVLFLLKIRKKQYFKNK